VSKYINQGLALEARNKGFDYPIFINSRGLFLKVQERVSYSLKIRG